jgi:ABC-2 type transport system permease protein
MAVYEHTYKQYTGRLTPDWSRFLILPRYAFGSIFQSKLFLAFFFACFICPLVMAILIYLKHNTNALGLLQLQINELLPIDASFFKFYVGFQGTLMFFLAMFVGPTLVARDMTNNALSLYLSRPFSRSEYILGKMSVLVILGSAITWAPGLLLFFFAAYLEGWAWFKENLYIASAIYFGCFVWIILLSLLSLAISAWVKWRIVSMAILIGLFFVPSIFGGFFNAVLLQAQVQTQFGNLMSLQSLINNAWNGLFGLFQREVVLQRFTNRRGQVIEQVTALEPPLWSSWAMLFLITAFCLLLLYAKIRAYEVVRS